MTVSVGMLSLFKFYIKIICPPSIQYKIYNNDTYDIAKKTNFDHIKNWIFPSSETKGKCWTCCQRFSEWFLW